MCRFAHRSLTVPTSSWPCYCVTLAQLFGSAVAPGRCNSKCISGAWCWQGADTGIYGICPQLQGIPQSWAGGTPNLGSTLSASDMGFSRTTQNPGSCHAVRLTPTSGQPPRPHGAISHRWEIARPRVRPAPTSGQAPGLKSSPNSDAITVRPAPTSGQAPGRKLPARW